MSAKVVSGSVIVFDMLLVAIAICVAVSAYSGWSIDLDVLTGYLPATLYISLIMFCVFGLYSKQWRYASLEELTAIVCAAAAGLAVSLLWFVVVDTKFIPAIVVTYYLLTIFFVGTGRQLIRFYRLFFIGRSRFQYKCAEVKEPARIAE